MLPLRRQRIDRAFAPVLPSRQEAGHPREAPALPVNARVGREAEIKILAAGGLRAGDRVGDPAPGKTTMIALMTMPVNSDGEESGKGIVVTVGE